MLPEANQQSEPTNPVLRLWCRKVPQPEITALCPPENLQLAEKNFLSFWCWHPSTAGILSFQRRSGYWPAFLIGSIQHIR